MCPHVQARGKGRFAPVSDAGFLSPIRASSSRAPSSSTQMPLQRLRGEEFGCRPNSSEVVIVCVSLLSFLCCVFSFCSLPVSCSPVKERIRSVCVCPHETDIGRTRAEIVPTHSPLQFVLACICGMLMHGFVCLRIRGLLQLRVASCITVCSCVSMRYANTSIS